jgi:hypothetical protein
MYTNVIVHNMLSCTSNFLWWNCLSFGSLLGPSAIGAGAVYNFRLQQNDRLLAVPGTAIMLFAGSTGIIQNIFILKIGPPYCKYFQIKNWPSLLSEYRTVRHPICPVPDWIKLMIPQSDRYQCCQLAEISAEKHKSGPIKISAAGRKSGRIFGRFFKKWQKSGRTFVVCVLHIKAFIIWRHRLANPWVHSNIFATNLRKRCL